MNNNNQNQGENILPMMSQNKNSKKNLALIIVGCIVILLIVFVLFLLIINNNNDNDVTQTTQTTTINPTTTRRTNVTQKEDDTNNSASSVNQAWISGEFSIAGVDYKLNTDYNKFVQNGWYVNMSKYGYSDGYLLNKNQKVIGGVKLENNTYNDVDISIGFINLSDTAKDITECQFWSIEVNNIYADTPVSFELPVGIKNGSTIEEIERVYGKISDDDIYRSDELGYTVYNYEYDFTYYLSLTVYDDGGLQKFSYKFY